MIRLSHLVELGAQLRLLGLGLIRALFELRAPLLKFIKLGLGIV